MRGSGWVHVKYIEYYEQLISCTWLTLPEAGMPALPESRLLPDAVAVYTLARNALGLDYRL